MENCLFCQISSGKIPSEIFYEDDDIVMFHDIHPQAPVHFLVVPKKHISSVDALSEEDKQLTGHIFLMISAQMKKLGLSEPQEGYRIVTNMGAKGGQTVGHIHFHVLAGRNLQWPPG